MPLQTDEYVVVIRYPKSLRTRCGEAWRLCGRIFGNLRYVAATLPVFLCIFSGLIYIFILVVVATVHSCHKEPGMSLDSMSVLNVTLYQNSTIPPPQSPWQVDSGFAVALSTWNPNTVAGCYSTLRRVNVRVEYRGQLILQQEVGLGFGLKPRARLPVAVDLKGEGFQLKNPDLGPFMQNELRNGAMYFGISFEARYKRNDRLLRWVKMGCLVLAQAPNSTQVGTLLSQDCV